MGQVIIIGDEVTAAGFRLAGVVCHSPEREELPGLLTEVGADCELVMITAEYAARLGAGAVGEMALWTRPLVAVVPDICNHEAPPNLENIVRRELGIEA